MNPRRHALLRSVSVALALVVGVALVGCGRPSTVASPREGRSGASSDPSSTLPAEGIIPPGAPRFDTPRRAVESYLTWVSFAYETGDSNVATMTFTSEEEVRVNSYVQLNSEKGRRIRQRLVSLDVGRQRTVGSIMQLPAHEVWDYRYFELAAARAVSPTYTATYDTTYTLIPRPQGGWIVDGVQAIPRTEVK